MPEKEATKAEGWVFKPSGSHPYVKTYTDDLGLTGDARSALESGLDGIFTNYAKQSESMGQANDPATAYGFSVSLLYSLATGKALDDKAFLVLNNKVRAALSDIQASDAQKQEFYEWSLCNSGLVITVAGAAKDEASTKQLRRLAEAQLLALTGAKLDQITLDGSIASIAGVPRQEPSASVGGRASGFSFAIPEGWSENSGWIVATKAKGSSISSALIRIPDAVPATGSFSDALHAAWNRYVPSEIRDRASGMVYRRYIGDGLFSQFIIGSGPEAGRSWDTLFTVFLIDCGSTWQPVVLAQTWRSTYGQNPSGGSLSAQFSFPETCDLAEVMLATFKCPAAKGKPIVDKSALVGDYGYGSSGVMNWQNIYTGSVTMTINSYGGTLSLNADGSFTDTFASANGAVGATQFRSSKGAGTWSISGDILVLKYSMYDQGDSYVRKEYKYRIAGLVTFSDGVKVAVLKTNLNQPVNSVTVANSSDYFTTKKK